MKGQDPAAAAAVVGGEGGYWTVVLDALQGESKQGGRVGAANPGASLVGVVAVQEREGGV